MTNGQTPFCTVGVFVMNWQHIKN